MAYSINCADGGAACSGSFTADSQDELMQHIQLHASVAHPEMEMTPETVEQVKSLIREV